LKLSQLGFFCAVVEHGTIAAAAASLHCVPSNIHYRQQVDNWLESSGIQPRAILEIESYPSIFACIAQGIGFACIPESYVDRFAR
jgi:Transcriptional regulator